MSDFLVAAVPVEKVVDLEKGYHDGRVESSVQIEGGPSEITHVRFPKHPYEYVRIKDGEFITWFYVVKE